MRWDSAHIVCVGPMRPKRETWIMRINVKLYRAHNGLWSWAFDHYRHKAWVGGFWSEHAARAHATECAIGIGRTPVFV